MKRNDGQLAVRPLLARWAALLLLMFAGGMHCAALPVANGWFDTDLAGWTTAGDVQAAGFAQLGDANTDYSLLYQAVATGPGAFRLEFDFQGALADNSPDFSDLFVASLYFIDNAAAFDLLNAPPVFDAVAGLMDLDGAGQLIAAGLIGPSALGPDWTHFTFDFNSLFAYAIPTFELIDLDGTGANSAMWIDNVVISEIQTVIPEPASLALVGLGLAGCIGARRRARAR